MKFTPVKEVPPKATGRTRSKKRSTVKPYIENVLPELEDRYYTINELRILTNKRNKKNFKQQQITMCILGLVANKKLDRHPIARGMYRLAPGAVSNASEPVESEKVAVFDKPAGKLELSVVGAMYDSEELIAKDADGYYYWVTPMYSGGN